VVHHVNGNRTDNTPENLLIFPGEAEHKLHHRRASSALRTPGENNDPIFCACGCGRSLRRFDGQGRPRRYMNGHNRRST
jgi:hypothetical protein